MACLNMFNNDQQSHCPSNPRISFSNDFADAQQQQQQQFIKHEKISYRDPPVSSDFEFSISSYGMISADEVIFKGKLLPVKEHCTKMTLRDELLVDDESEDDLVRTPKGSSGRWKERFGLKRAFVVPKKADNSEDFFAYKTGPT
ncbi:uncharacterized protein LOC130779309 [Actinidia eriantha]|uniref:uncharacterized protein LOC130779309 n=1 Tax=Actinidia eriantha TaxID=165200 RepID=UPI002582B517|nr:uncharacterized protein LOC130779309 [Actinidia eriantha]